MSRPLPSQKRRDHERNNLLAFVGAMEFDDEMGDSRRWDEVGPRPPPVLWSRSLLASVTVIDVEGEENDA